MEKKLEACSMNCLKICFSTSVFQILYFEKPLLVRKAFLCPLCTSVNMGKNQGGKNVFGEGGSFQPRISGSGLWIICCRSVASNSAFSR